MEAATTPQFDVTKLGSSADPVEFEVTQERIQEYAAATNDPIAQHVAGEIAPPVFAIVPSFQALAHSTSFVIPPEMLMMIVHGEQDFHFHAPIRPGMELVTTASPIGVHGRSSGVTVVARSETREKASGELLNEQYMTVFVRGGQLEGSYGETAPDHGFDESLRAATPLAEVTQTFDADQTFRYSKASGDPMPIHLDDDFAKSVGLPGIIIHGLCTMAFTSVAAIQTACPEDPARLRRLAVRFAKIVQPGQTITTRLYDAGPGRLAYETTSNEGAVVIKDGLAEIA